MASYAGARMWKEAGRSASNIGSLVGGLRREEEEKEEREAAIAREEARYQGERDLDFAIRGGARGQAPQIERRIGGPSTAERPGFKAPELLEPPASIGSEIGKRFMQAPDFSAMRRPAPTVTDTDPTYRQHGTGDSAFYLPDQDVVEDRAYRTGRTRASEERAELLSGEIDAENRRLANEKEMRMAPQWQAPIRPQYDAVNTDRGIVRMDMNTGEQHPTGMNAPPSASSIPPGPGSTEYRNAGAILFGNANGDGAMFPNSEDFSPDDKMRMIEEYMAGERPTPPSDPIDTEDSGPPWWEGPLEAVGRGIGNVRDTSMLPTTPRSSLAPVGSLPSASDPPRSGPGPRVASELERRGGPTAPAGPPVGREPLSPSDKQQAQADPGFRQWLTQNGYTEADWR